MPFITQGKTNIKYILIGISLIILSVFIIGFLIVGGSIESAICFFKGGKWFQSVHEGYPFCNLRYSDGGNSCSDSEQCEGRCLAPPDASTPPDALGTFTNPPKSGECEKYHTTFGCYWELKGGEAEENCAIP